jgi:hypothetical protein
LIFQKADYGPGKSGIRNRGTMETVPINDARKGLKKPTILNTTRSEVYD